MLRNLYTNRMDQEITANLRKPGTTIQIQILNYAIWNSKYPIRNSNMYLEFQICYMEYQICILNSKYPIFS